MKPFQIVAVLVLSAAVAFATASFVGGGKRDGQTAQSTIKETRLEQVKRTGVLRCGYAMFPPYLVKDLKTGKMSGAFYDILEEVGRQLKLKIEWTAEVAPGAMFADLNMNRYDMICTLYAANPSRSREGDFTVPIFYTSLFMQARKDDVRFDNNYERANQPDVTFAIQDGDFSAIIANEDFPLAKKHAIPQITTITENYVAVATKKADVVVEETYSFADYDTANPGLLKTVEGKPLRLLGCAFPIPAGEPAYKAMLDTTINYLHDSGFINKTLNKYETKAKSMRVAKHYQE